MTTQTILYGIAPVQQCLLNRNRQCHELLIKAETRSPRIKELISLASKRGIRIKEISAQGIADVSKTKLHQGVVLVCSELNLLSLEEFVEQMQSNEKVLLIALDQVEDPQNVGAIIRSAAFLGAGGLITLKTHSAPLSAAVSKASAGALEYFPIIEVANLSEAIQWLKRNGFFVIGSTLDRDSIEFNQIPLTDHMVLVMGNEGQGLRKLTQKRCDQLVHIPGNFQTESLNVSAAAAILIQYLVNAE